MCTFEKGKNNNVKKKVNKNDTSKHKSKCLKEKNAWE